MEKKRISSIIKDVKKEKFSYTMGGKPVSEFKFFKSLAREISGKPSKKSFYWTDKKVISAFKLLGAKITQQELNIIKKQLTSHD